MPVIIDRYMIGDPCCGVVSSHSTRQEATEAAQAHAAKGCAQVRIFDSMAHFGAPEMFDTRGRVYRLRAKPVTAEIRRD